MGIYFFYWISKGTIVDGSSIIVIFKDWRNDNR